MCLGGSCDRPLAFRVGSLEVRRAPPKLTQAPHCQPSRAPPDREDGANEIALRNAVPMRTFPRPDDINGSAVQAECVRTFWVMLSPSNVSITCALYRIPAGFELRAGHGEEDLLLRQTVFTDTAAER